jgi:CheY-like chemotaxis protein
VVLVVEDDQASREMLQRLLVKEGCHVVLAVDGLEALQKMKQAPPDLILLDLMMPEMNGFDFVAQLRRGESPSKVPIVIVTAKELTAEDRAALNGQVAHVFRKGGFARDELLAEIRELLAAVHG